MKIVLTTVGTTGDVRPFLALAQRLLAAGHMVRVCSYELYREPFEQYGIEFVGLRPSVAWNDIQAASARVAQLRSPLQQAQVLQNFHLHDGPQHYADCRAATQGFDLAICHTIHTLGQAAVLDNGLPWVGVHLDPSLLQTSFAPPATMPNLGRWGNRALWRVLERFMARLDPALHTTLIEAGSQQRDLKMFRTPSPLLNLVACSPHIAHAPPDLPPTFVFTGSWMLEEAWSPPRDLQAFIEDDPPPLVVSFGSMVGDQVSRTTAALIEAIQQTRQRAIIQRGLADLDIAASSQILPVDYVPHRYLFAHTPCVIHHGGAGTTAAACAAGVPSIVVPHVGDQVYWATRLHKLGVAPKPLPITQLNARALSERIEHVLDSLPMRRAAQFLAGKMRHEGGVNEAVKLIEQRAIS